MAKTKRKVEKKNVVKNTKKVNLSLSAKKLRKQSTFDMFEESRFGNI